ncbi:MAG: histidine kinase, partial [Ktedonobacterales bacterium]
MSETRPMEQRPMRHWSMGEGLALSIDNAMYGATAIGYLFALLSPNNTFKWPGFLLLTVACGAWIAVYSWFNLSDGARKLNVAITGLIISALLAQSAAFWGVQLDWLAPVLTVGVIAAAFPVLKATWLSALMLLSTVIIVALLDVPGGGGLLGSLRDCITIVPAFAFAFVFSLAMTVQDRQRAEAEHLLARLEEAHAQLRTRAKEAEELAVAQERNRMAREIHDTLGHYLTILAVELETA